MVMLSEDEIKDENLTDLVHSVKERETKTKITDQDNSGGEKFRNEKSRLNPPKRKPTNKGKKI